MANDHVAIVTLLKLLVSFPVVNEDPNGITRFFYFWVPITLGRLINVQNFNNVLYE